MYNSNRHFQQLHAYKSHFLFFTHPLFINLERDLIIRINIRDLLAVCSLLRCSQPQWFIIRITYLQGGSRNVIPLIVHVTHFLLQKHLTSGTELILIG